MQHLKKKLLLSVEIKQVAAVTYQMHHRHSIPLATVAVAVEAALLVQLEVRTC